MVEHCNHTHLTSCVVQSPYLPNLGVTLECPPFASAPDTYGEQVYQREGGEFMEAELTSRARVAHAYGTPDP